MAYKTDTNDSRLTAVTSEEDKELAELDTTYDKTISDSDSFYNEQIQASKDWEKTQTDLQNKNTDFAIEKIEQQKDQTHKDYIKEQSGAYKDWQKQSNAYGVNAERQASSGLTNSGYSESSQVSMYTAYQNRVASTRESYGRAILNYDNAIKEARLQNNSILAQIAYESLQKQLTLALEGFQYKNTLVQQKAAEKRAIQSLYHTKYQSVLDQIYKEDSLNEQMRQFDKNYQLNQEQLALQKAQFEWQKEQAAAKASSGGSSGGSSSRSSKIQKQKASAAELRKIPDRLKQNNNKKNEKSEPTVDQKSVLALGYGPISAKKLNSLVEQGIVTEYEEGGKLKFKKTFGSAANKRKYGF